MMKDVIIQPMTEQFLVWRCLHDGPLMPQTIGQLDPNDSFWDMARPRNEQLLRKLIATYGTCAMLAMDGDRVVGTLRFYPKVLMQQQQGMCLQQLAPAGPTEETIARSFPPLGELEDKTLVVHCMMIGSRPQTESPYRRRGIGTRLVQALVIWAQEQGWQAIEATAHQGLPVLWEISGGTDRRFWEKFGFTYVDTYIEPTIDEDSDLYRLMQEQAIALDLAPESARHMHRMRLVLDLQHS